MKEVIHAYEPEQVGHCAVWNTETGRTEVTGELMQQTVKLRDTETGEISIDWTYFPKEPPSTPETT